MSSEKYTVQELKEHAVKDGFQFVHIVMAGGTRVMIIERFKTRIYEMGSGDITDNRALFQLTHTLPTTFEFPPQVMPVYQHKER